MNMRDWSNMAALLCATALPCVALADDLPSFRPGLWEFKRSVEGTNGAGKPLNTEIKKCVDPTADMRKMNEALTKQGCKASSVVKSGNAYSFTTDCQIQGVPMQSRSVVTVESDSAYKVDVTSKGGARSTTEALVAKRIGECKE
jgi:hypothetical protein